MSIYRAERLNGVNPALVSVVKRASARLPFDILVIEGVRTQARQDELYAQGRTKPGKVVTWTRSSKHILGQAVDIAPQIAGAIPWGDAAKFDQIAKAMFHAADDLKVKIRWGRDWNQNGKPGEKGESDSPHWEIA